jgi:diguanylate cyclase (GGDEF)-like protein
VRRSGGLGRGLAALLPSADDPQPHPVGHHFRPAGAPPEPDDGTGAATTHSRSGADEETAVADLGTELVAELATNQSGLAIIYRALDGLVEQHALHDAAVVIQENGLGRQVFRAGRKPLDDPGGEALLDAAPGLYTDPPLEAAAVDASLVTSLCVVALRMEVLRYDSWHDPLTGLFDRRSFDRLLEMSVARSLRYHWPFTLVVIDLDGLKEINDREGHAGGDAALRALGERFRRILRFGDNAARIGGDEFALILPNTDPDDVPPLLERIGSTQLGDRPCPAFSYGVAQCPSEADDMTSLFKLADSRLYEAKNSRR